MKKPNEFRDELQGVVGAMGSYFELQDLCQRDPEFNKLLNLAEMGDENDKTPLSREKLLETLLLNDISFSISRVRILVERGAEDCLDIQLVSQELINTLKSQGYDFQLERSIGRESIGGELYVNWNVLPKNILNDPNLILEYNIAPDLFPTKSVFKGQEEEIDMRTGKPVKSSNFKIEERCYRPLRNKIAYQQLFLPPISLGDVIKNYEQIKGLLVLIKECED